MNIKKILEKKNINSDYIELSNKDGVIILELMDLPNNPIFKYFYKEEYRREIQYYDMFRNNSIQTINVLKTWQDAILLDNLKTNANYRLATIEDLSNKEVVFALAKWFKNLHNLGKRIIKRDTSLVTFSEFNHLNKEVLHSLEVRSNYNNKEYWILLQNTIEEIMPYYLENATITYNDFYYGNVIVSRDLTSAFMFDYNFLGKGLAYSDIANVLTGLEPKMHDSFLKAYGEFIETEKEIDKIVSPIIALVIAFKRNEFPNWAKIYLDRLLSGELHNELLMFRQKYSSINN